MLTPITLATSTTHIRTREIAIKIIEVEEEDLEETEAKVGIRVTEEL